MNYSCDVLELAPNIQDMQKTLLGSTCRLHVCE